MNYIEVIPRRTLGPTIDLLTYQTETELSPGTIVTIPVGKKQAAGIVVRSVPKPDFATKPIIGTLDTPLPAQTLELIQWTAKQYATSLGTVLRHALPAGMAKKRRIKADGAATPPRHMSGLTLSSEQSAIVHAILASTPGTTSILHGDTGAGKTLVYRELIRATLAAQQSCMVLVPEIGLTTQLSRDVADLGATVHVFHSELSEAERHVKWLQILQQSTPSIIVGPRSALFAPVQNLGLIVVDECHETAYKQDAAPRYHALSAAVRLGALHKARVVLGSATPRIQDVYRSASHTMPIHTIGKYNAGQPPRVEVITKTDQSAFVRSRILSDTLVHALEASLNSQHQSLLYLNRRGTSLSVICQACGWRALCPNCDTALTHHKDTSQLLCHICGWHQPIMPVCPECASSDILYRGVGTKRVMDEIQSLFPNARVARFDSDSKAGEHVHDRYDDILSGQVDILIGTQGIARGLDLPLLDTVGVVSADNELLIPDYSASERAFQLLYQVIGRVGRMKGGGTVVIQTLAPDHPAIAFAINQDYQGFYNHELADRKAHGFPPFEHLLQLTNTYPGKDAAQRAAERLASSIRRTLGKRVRILGPAPAFYSRRGTQHRFTLVIAAKNRNHLVHIARSIGTNAHWQADLDPINLLS